MHIVQAGGGTFQIPFNDIRISNHCNDPRNHVETILDQINRQQIYSKVIKRFNGRRDLTVIDAGANIGLFSMYIQDICKKVYSVEPTPTHMALLKAMTAGFNIQPVQVALSDKDQEITFYLCDQNPTMNSLVNSYGESIKVQGRRLDSLINEFGDPQIDLIKVDIEGSEIVAITDDVISAVKDKVDSWIIELHSNPKWNWYETTENIGAIFTKNGYQVEPGNTDTIWAYKPSKVFNIVI